MRINYKNGNIIVEDVMDFDLGETLECGQCFRYDKIGNNDYIIVAMKRMLHISQKGRILTFYNTSRQDYEEIWEDYFDLKRDYGKIFMMKYMIKPENMESIFFIMFRIHKHLKDY